jgi:hypothetical protein
MAHDEFGVLAAFVAVAEERSFTRQPNTQAVEVRLRAGVPQEREVLTPLRGRPYPSAIILSND